MRLTFDLFTLRRGLSSGLWRARHACNERHHARSSSLRCTGLGSAAQPQSRTISSGGDSIRPGQILELRCSGLSSAGEGVCRTDSGCVVFVERALPGELVRARLVLVKKSFARAVKLASLSPYDAAATPPCPHFGPCGGCTLQALDYGAQLGHKRDHVVELLARVGRVEGAAGLVRPIIPCQQEYQHRNKMEFSFSAQRWQPARAGEDDGASSRAGLAAGGAQGNSTAGQARERRGTSRQPGGGAAAAAPRRRGGQGLRRGPELHSSGGGGDGSVAAGFALGLFRPGSNRVVLPVEECHLQPGVANELLRLVGRLCQEAALEPYDPAVRRGLLQALVIRTASGSKDAGGSTGGVGGEGSVAGAAAAQESDRSSGEGASGSGGVSKSGGGQEVLLNLVTARDGRRALQQLVPAIMQQFPNVVGIVNTVSDPSRPLGERAVTAEHLLHGRPFLQESLCGLDFEVSANSFFQTNTRQAERLYKLVAQAAELRPSDIVLDLYCGTGTIALSLARSCREVYGVEVVTPAVEDARRNAARNRITNARFVLGDLERPGASELLAAQLPRPDIVVVDPARPGLSSAVVAFLRSSSARRVVYVSCNPATQARDIALLCAPPSAGAGIGGGAGGSSTSGGSSSGGGRNAIWGSGSNAEAQYRLAWVQPCDMFPQTMHVETVAVLDRVGAQA